MDRSFRQKIHKETQALTLYLSKLEKEEQKRPKLVEKKIIKIRAKINEKEMKDMRVKINKIAT